MEEQSERTTVYPKARTAGDGANFTVRDPANPVASGRVHAREIAARATDRVRANTDDEADPDRENIDGAIGRCRTIVVGAKECRPAIYDHLCLIRPFPGRHHFPFRENLIDFI
jgi:hypothetical protein